MAVVLPAEPDAAVFDLQQAVVGDSDAVSVASEVLNDLGGAAEWALGIDDPALTAGRTQPAVEGFWIGERGQIAKETELSLLKGQPQCVLEQMAEASTENFDREEEVLAMFLRATAGDPVLAVRRETAAGDNAMQVWVVNQLLAPGVEDGEEAELGTEVFGIGSDGAERGGHGLKQQAVDDGLVLQGQPGDGLRQSEDHVEIDDGQ